MSIHAHAAPHIASHGALHGASDGSLTASLSVRTRRQIAIADMSETAARGTVVELTLCDRRGRMSFSSLEISIVIAFDDYGVPS